jgi:hypothetical protein
MLKFAITVTVGFSESVTETSNTKACPFSQLQFVVPLITPALDNVNPLGSDPVTNAHVYGVVPPLAARVAEYATPVIPPGNVRVVIVRLE